MLIYSYITLIVKVKVWYYLNANNPFPQLLKEYVKTRTLEAKGVKVGNEWKIEVRDDPTVVSVWIPSGKYRIEVTRYREQVPMYLSKADREQILGDKKSGIPMVRDRGGEHGALTKKGFVKFMDRVFFAVDDAIDWIENYDNWEKEHDAQQGKIYKTSRRTARGKLQQIPGRNRKPAKRRVR